MQHIETTGNIPGTRLKSVGWRKVAAGVLGVRAAYMVVPSKPLGVSCHIATTAYVIELTLPRVGVYNSVTIILTAPRMRRPTREKTRSMTNESDKGNTEAIHPGATRPPEPDAQQH